MIKIIHGQLYSNDFSKLEKIAKDYSSCVRYAYNQFHKYNRTFNEVRNLAKIKYTTLNTRQISDAVLEGNTANSRFKAQIKLLKKEQKKLEKKLKEDLPQKTKIRLQKKLKRMKHKIKYHKTVFGGRKLWNDLKKGKISKEQWQNERDCKIYARGDQTKFGNPNLRIVDNNLRITIGNHQFESHKLFIPNKFQKQLNALLKSGIAYNVRLKKQDQTHWQVWIDYEYQEPNYTVDFKNGAIGVDLNPDRFAIANITKNGNLIESFTKIESRLQHGSTNKRNYDIGCLVKEIIEYAKKEKKGIVFENLDFERYYKENETKWNRIKSNFVWRKTLGLLERKCIENGICHRKINPAYTSVIGCAKYQQMYGLTIHESASYVIARRGLRFNEKIIINNVEAKRVKEVLIGTLAGKYNKKRIHSWILWKQVKAVLTGLRKEMRDLKEFRGKSINLLLIDYFRNESENLSSEIFLQELVVGSNCNDLGSRRTTLQTSK